MADFDILYQLLTRSKNIPKDPCFDLEPKQFGKISFCFSHLKTKKKWNSTLVLEQYQWWIPMGRTVYLRTFTIEINHSWIGNIIPFIPWESYIQQHPCMVCIVYIDHILPLKTNQILVNIPVPWMVWVKSPIFSWAANRGYANVQSSAVPTHDNCFGKPWQRGQLSIR